MPAPSRQDWRNRPLHAPPELTPEAALAGPGAQPDNDAVLVIGQWYYAGRGHTPGEAAFARTIAEDIAENRRIWRLVTSTFDD